MSGCFPTGDPCRCKCHTLDTTWNGTECCLCHKDKFYHKNYSHTDVNSACYKNHQIVMNEINCIKNETKKIRSDFTDQIYKIVNKKPHKCPVCEGRGNITIQEIKLALNAMISTSSDQCNACKGNGIIWG